MRGLGAAMGDPHAKPLALLLVVVAGFAALDGGHGRFLSVATAFGTLETFATLGLVALGLGVTMVMGEFDLSVAGVFGMAGCVAVLTGATHPVLGVLAAVTLGLAAGAAQGALIAGLRLSSVGVTLGGLLTTVGIAFVLTRSTAISYDNMDVALAIGDPYLGVFTPRSLVALAGFGIAAVLAATRIGRDVVATGSDRTAALVAGVGVGGLVLGGFAISGACAALSGALLSYALASASPAGLADVLVPAVTAAIVGGVSLSGGTGRPLGIAMGVLVVAVLRSGFNAIGTEPWVGGVVTGLVLLLVAALDAPAIARRLRGGAAAT